MCMCMCRERVHVMTDIHGEPNLNCVIYNSDYCTVYVYMEWPCLHDMFCFGWPFF